MCDVGVKDNLDQWITSGVEKEHNRNNAHMNKRILFLMVTKLDLVHRIFFQSFSVY